MNSSHHRLHCHWQPSHLVVNLMVELVAMIRKNAFKDGRILLVKLVAFGAWAFSLVKVVNMLLIFSSRWKGVHQVAIRFSKLMVPKNYN